MSYTPAFMFILGLAWASATLRAAPIPVLAITAARDPWNFLPRLLLSIDHAVDLIFICIPKGALLGSQLRLVQQLARTRTPQLTVVDLDWWLMVPSCWNAAISSQKAPWYLFLDYDVHLPPGSLESFSRRFSINTVQQGHMYNTQLKACTYSAFAVRYELLAKANNSRHLFDPSGVPLGFLEYEWHTRITRVLKPPVHPLCFRSSKYRQPRRSIFRIMAKATPIVPHYNRHLALHYKTFGEFQRIYVAKKWGCNNDTCYLHPFNGSDAEFKVWFSEEAMYAHFLWSEVVMSQFPQASWADKSRPLFIPNRGPVTEVTDAFYEPADHDPIQIQMIATTVVHDPYFLLLRLMLSIDHPTSQIVITAHLNGTNVAVQLGHIKRIFPQLKVVEFHGYPGYAEGWNMPLRVSNASYMVFAAYDVVFVPGQLAKLARQLSQLASGFAYLRSINGNVCNLNAFYLTKTVWQQCRHFDETIRPASNEDVKWEINMRKHIPMVVPTCLNVSYFHGLPYDRE